MIGPWADFSVEWDKLSTEIKTRVNHDPKPDGEFWMPYTYFIRHFEQLEMCHLGPDSYEAFDMRGRDVSLNDVWKSAKTYGKWSKKEGTAAGHPTSLSIFSRSSPLFVLLITRPLRTSVHSGTAFPA